MFLASKSLGALPNLFPQPLPEVRFTFVVTATKVYGDAPWIKEDGIALRKMGFLPAEVDLEEMNAADCEAIIANSDVVYVQGGNTFYLLHAMQQCDFGDAIRRHPQVIYAGASAGAIVAGCETEHVSAIDDRTVAPELRSTRGLALAPFNVLPHFGHEPWRQQLDRIVETYASPAALITICDDEAIVVRDDKYEIVRSENP